MAVSRETATAAHIRLTLSRETAIGTRVLVDGEVIECDPPRRLVHTWIVKYDPELTAEGASRVAWELEDQDGVTKLTCVHDGFPENSRVYDNVAGGWMLVLSGVKSLVETGAPLVPETEAATA